MDAYERAAVERRISDLEARLDTLPRPLDWESMAESMKLQGELGELLRTLDKPVIVKLRRRSARVMRRA